MTENKSHLKTVLQAIDEVKKRGPIPFIWGGIKKGSFGFIFGPSKCGKTTFCENLAMKLVSDETEFMGKPLEENRLRILFISLEEYEQPRSERNDLQVRSSKVPTEFMQNLLVVDDEFPKRLENESDFEILSDTIEESKAEVVFIDSLSRASKGDIERSDTAKEIILKLKDIAHNLGITMVVIHHTPKLYGRPLSIDSLAGSHIFAQEADFIIGISKVVGSGKYNGVRYLKEVAYRYKRDDDENVTTFSINEDRWIEQKESLPEFRLFESADGRVDDTNLNAIRNFIRLITQENASATFTTEELFERTENKMNRSTTFQKIRELEDLGEISRTKRGIYRYNSTSIT